MASNNLKGASLGLLSMAIFATHDAVVKSLGGTLTAFQIVFFAALFSFPIISVILLKDRREGHLRPVHPWWVMTRAMCNVVTGVTAFYAFTTLPLAQVYPLLFATPLLITVMSIPLLGETVRLRRWAAVIVGLLGVLVVVRPGQADLTLGHLAALTSAVCGALASVIVRKIGPDERSVVLLLYPMVANFVAMAIAMPFVYVPMELPELGALAIIALFGLTASFLQILAYRAGEAVIVAPMQYSQIIWAVIFGYFFFGESIDGPTMAGAAIVISSGLYIVFRESSSDASENQPVLRTRGRNETAITPRSSLLQRVWSQGRRG